MKVICVLGVITVLIISCDIGFGQKPTPTPTPTAVQNTPNTDSGKWKEFVSTEGKCKVQGPGPVSDESSPSPYIRNEKTFEYVVRTDYVLIKLGFSKVPSPPKYNDEAIMKPFYDKFIANMAKGEKMTVLEQSDFRVGDAFGKEATFSEGELIHVNRYILRDQTLYILTTTTYKENHNYADVKLLRRQFLDSFQFVN